VTLGVLLKLDRSENSVGDSWLRKR